MAPSLNTGRRWFGDVVLEHTPGGVLTVISAPPVTRIQIGELVRHAAQPPALATDGQHLVLAGTVWYRPFEFDEATGALICEKTRDLRPLMTQVTDRH